MRWYKALPAVLLSAFLLTACSTPQTVPEASSALPSSSGAPVSSIPEAPPIVEELLPVEEYSDPREEPITHILLHFMSDAKANPENPYQLERLRQIFLEGGVSTHYLIGRDGTIYRLIPDDRVAWHAGKGTWKEEAYTDRMNAYSIGIEMMAVGSQDDLSDILTEEEYARIREEDVGFTEEQYAALNRLLPYLRARYGIPADRDHILGHEEYSPRKTDPGELFDWSRIGL